MSIRKAIPEFDGIYFITLTCCRWIKLFDLACAYHAVYKWFDFLKGKGHLIIGYVIMPNHLHALLAFRNTQSQSINKLVGNGKRFMAYEIVSQLKSRGENDLLNTLSGFVNSTERNRGKLHEVFEPSFDWKKCFSERFIHQKLNYIHNNPCQGNWSLVDEPGNYQHSSAKYYSTGEQGIYEVTDYKELEDIDLTKDYEVK